MTLMILHFYSSFPSFFSTCVSISQQPTTNDFAFLCDTFRFVFGWLVGWLVGVALVLFFSFFTFSFLFPYLFFTYSLQRSYHVHQQ